MILVESYYNSKYQLLSFIRSKSPQFYDIFGCKKHFWVFNTCPHVALAFFPSIPRSEISSAECGGDSIRVLLNPQHPESLAGKVSFLSVYFIFILSKIQVRLFLHISKRVLRLIPFCLYCHATTKCTIYILSCYENIFSSLWFLKLFFSVSGQFVINWHEWVVNIHVDSRSRVCPIFYPPMSVLLCCTTHVLNSQTLCCDSRSLFLYPVPLCYS